MGDMSDKMSGQAKDTMGKITGNKRQELQGKALKARGQAKDKAEDFSSRLREERDKRGY